MAYTVPDFSHHATGYIGKYSLLNFAKRLVIAPNFIGEYSGRWLSIRNHYPNGLAFGGFIGTALGFAKFLQDQLRKKSVLFDTSTQPLFFAQQQTIRGRAVPMTLGWHIGKGKSGTFLFKEGGGGGFHCMMHFISSRTHRHCDHDQCDRFSSSRCAEHCGSTFPARSAVISMYRVTSF
jgi:hypothetical protein